MITKCVMQTFSCSRFCRYYWSSGRLMSSFRGREEAVVVTNDGKTIVCWHPEPKFPYNCTKPLPEVAESDSVLKVQLSAEAKKLFIKKHPYFVNKDLRELTFTTKHVWFPHNQKFKASKKAGRDREYL